MSVFLEGRKIKRTGFFSAFFFGGLLASAVPLLNMAVRSENYTGLSLPSLQILLEANWQMMAMLNVFLAVAGGCMLYHTEFAENAIQKMNALPVKESGMFFGKFFLMMLMCLMDLALEMAAIAFCQVYWFSEGMDLWGKLLENAGFFFLLMLPALMLSLLVSSLCKNMWISLGIGVICVFLATMLPAGNFVLSLFPYALPFQTLEYTKESVHLAAAAGIETVGIAAAEILCLKVRRYFA